MTTLAEKLGKFYRVEVRCYNCGERQQLRIPKGKTIKEFISSEDAKCEKCGCATLSIHGTSLSKKEDNQNNPLEKRKTTDNYFY